MKLTQGTVFSTTNFEITESSLVCWKKSRFSKSKADVSFDEIDFSSVYKRDHIDAWVFTLTFAVGLFAMILLFTQFKIFSNEDLFVVLCGVSLIILVGFRVLKSSSRKEIVLPTANSGEIIIRSEKPDKKSVDQFMAFLYASVIEFNERVRRTYRTDIT
ncbi:MAG: hypothetical protein JXR03_11220 [Cyclobacteriaceae bacterium]